MNEFSLLRERYDHHFGFQDMVVCAYGDKKEEKKYSYQFKYTYCPESKVWSHQETRFSSKGTVEHVTGIKENEFPLLLKNRYEYEFEARSLFYDKAAVFLRNPHGGFGVSNVREFNWGVTRLVLDVDVFDEETGMKMVFMFGKGGKLNEARVQESFNAGSEKVMRFIESTPFPSSIVRMQHRLCEESEYRMKLLML